MYMQELVEKIEEMKASPEWYGNNYDIIKHNWCVTCAAGCRFRAT